MVCMTWSIESSGSQVTTSRVITWRASSSIALAPWLARARTRSRSETMPATEPSPSSTSTEPMRRVLSCWESWATEVPGVTVKTRPPFCARMSETNMVPSLPQMVAM